VAETVLALRAAGQRLGIVSSKYRYRIERLLAERRLASQVEGIIGGADVPQHMRDPQGRLLALQRLTLPAPEVLYVGDHPVDAEAASRAGLPFMAILTGVSDVPSFTPYPVHSFLANVSHLPSQLQMLG